MTNSGRSNTQVLPEGSSNTTANLVVSYQGVGIAALVVVLSSFYVAAFLQGYVATEQDLLARLLPPLSHSPRGLHILGTDQLGRDMLALIVAGTVPLMSVTILGALCAAVFGSLFGQLAGYFGGWLARILMTVSNIQLSFPFFLLAISVVGIFSPSFGLVVFAIALGTWVPFARVVYTDTSVLARMEFVDAVRVMQGSHSRVLFKHILRNAMPNIIVIVVLSFASGVMIESGLSFLGLGLPGDTPTWGRILSEGRDYAATAWWLSVFPGIAIFLSVLTFNLVGGALGAKLDK